MSMSISWPWKSISTMSHCDPHPSADELAVLDPASSASKRVPPTYEVASGPAICIGETLMLVPAMLVFVPSTLVSTARASHATLSTFLAILAPSVVELAPSVVELPVSVVGLAPSVVELAPPVVGLAPTIPGLTRFLALAPLPINCLCPRIP
jgi:hypothetical protein